MSKVRLVLLSSLMAAFLVTSAGASYSYVPERSDLWDLDHYKYYVCKIDDFVALGPGHSITSATLTIDNINNWNDNTNHLYIHLLSGNDFELGNNLVSAPFPASSTETIFVGYDGQGQSDNAANYNGIHLDTYIDTDGGSGGAKEDYEYHFTEQDLAALSSYASDGVFGLGFDPDCHYWNDGVKLEITTVPEPATMVLLVLGGLVLRRRPVADK